MATTIKLKNSVTTTAAPSTLVQGEAAVNVTDKKVWVGDASSSPVQIIGAGAPVSGTTGTFTGNVSVAGTFAANGGATLGDASGDALTINSSAVSIPNGLNFDSNTLVIDATNNRVGVGTASPSESLQIRGSADTFAFIDSTGATNKAGISVGNGGSTYGQLYFDNTNNNVSLLQKYSSGSLVLGTNSTERMRIDSSGNVGIGTSSPSSYANYTTVTQNGTSGVEYDFKIGGTLAGYFEVTSTLFKFDAESTRYFQWVSNGSEKMRLDSSGNLGLGVTPSAWSGFNAMQLGVTGFISGRPSNEIVLLGSNAYNNGSWRYTASGNFATLYQQDSGIHKFYTAPSGTAGNAITFTQAMTLDASGNLLLGTSSNNTGLSASPKQIIYGSTITDGSGAYPTTLSIIDDRAYNSTSPSAGGGICFGYKYTSGGAIALGPSIQGFKENTTDSNYASGLSFLTRAQGSNPAERMRIDSSGNVGIGTSSPNSPLSFASSTGQKIRFYNTLSGYGIGVESSEFRFVTDNGAIFTWGTGTYASPTERMRIDSSGNLLVGTTGTLNTTQSGNYLGTGGSSYIGTGHANGTGSGASYTAYYYNAGYIGGITQNGTTAVAYNTTSDYRLKENVAPLTGALAKVQALKPVSYTWKSAPDEMGEGFIAHELAEVCPLAVTGEKDAVDAEGNPVYQGIDTSFLVATLTAAIQELKAEVDSLKAQLNK